MEKLKKKRFYECYFTLIVGRQVKKLKEVLAHVNRTLVVSSSFTIALLQL